MRQNIVSERKQPAIAYYVVIPAWRTNCWGGRLMLGVEQKSVEDGHDAIIRDVPLAVIDQAVRWQPT